MGRNFRKSKETSDIRIPEAERAYLAGLLLRYESEVVYHNMKEFEKVGDYTLLIRILPKGMPRPFQTVFSEISTTNG